MACDHKRSHLGVDFGNFQQYLCMHSTHKNAVCYYSLEIISLIWLPMAANYAMQLCYGCAVYCLSVQYTYVLCKVYPMSQRSCFGEKIKFWNQKYSMHAILFFQIGLTLSLKAITKGSSSYHLCAEYFSQFSFYSEMYT